MFSKFVLILESLEQVFPGQRVTTDDQARCHQNVSNISAVAYCIFVFLGRQKKMLSNFLAVQMKKRMMFEKNNQ